MVNQSSALAGIISASLRLATENPTALVEKLHSMGADHKRSYGVHDEYYSIVGATLVASLEKRLGSTVFTPEVKEAWITLYGFLSREMIEGGKGIEVEQPESESWKGCVIS